MNRYILEGHTPVICKDLMKWAAWFESADRHVAKDTVGKVDISTVFLGLDHSYNYGVPILFETMIFGGEYDEYQERCSTWEEAEVMHKTAVALIKGDSE